MSFKASLWRRAALTLVAGAAIALPSAASADILGGLSIRAGAFFPQRSALRDVTDIAAFGGGIEYKVPWFPRLLEGEAWSSSISVDFHYSERGGQIFRYIPASINQIYTFEEQHGRTPYAGFCFTAATFGGTGIQNINTDRTRGTVPNRLPTITRFGGGLIAGLHFGNHLYIEGRYEWIDSHGTSYAPEGFRAYVGWRF